MRPASYVLPGRAVALLVLALVLAAGPAAVAEVKIAVSATVLKRASLQLLAQPAALIVTASDLARGYVEVPAATRVAIRSNSPDGYLMEFSSDSDFIRQVHVDGLDTAVQLEPAGGIVAQRGTGSVVRTTLQLGYRFVLADNAREGRHPWPMRMSIGPR